MLIQCVFHLVLRCPVRTGENIIIKQFLFLIRQLLSVKHLHCKLTVILLKLRNFHFLQFRTDICPIKLTAEFLDKYIRIGKRADTGSAEREVLVLMCKHKEIEFLQTETVAEPAAVILLDPVLDPAVIIRKPADLILHEQLTVHFKIINRLFYEFVHHFQ